MSDALLSTVRQRRTRLGLSQTELAALVGMSRQALSAIEAGRQVPSTARALQLARALGCTVHDLFRLSGAEVVTARLATAAGDTRRVVVGRVNGRWVAHPVRRADQPADGLLLQPALAGQEVPVELIGDPAELETHMLVAGCAPLLGLLAARTSRRFHQARTSWIPAHSTGALRLLADGYVHVAGLHLAESHDPFTHPRLAHEALGDAGATVLHLARWRQGLVLARGNPKGIRGGHDLTRPDVRLAQRPQGAGAQKLLQRVLASAGASEAPTPGPIATDHQQIAQLVLWGVVDVGVAISSVAHHHGLEFVALAEERFDLVIPSAHLAQASAFASQIDTPAFRAEGGALVGYDLSEAGQAATLATARGR